MIKHLPAYLEYKRSEWSEKTLRSESSRASRALLLSQDPTRLFEKLQAQGQKLYSIKTTFIRLADMEDWCVRTSLVSTPSGFREFYRRHKNRFKHAYLKEEVAISYAEAVQRIELLSEPYRTASLELLRTGLRVSEPKTFKDGQVIGKGGKPRKVFGEITVKVPPSTLWLKLKGVGLKPHMLRKLCATNLGANGAGPADLCKVFGWSSIGTAYQYLQSKDDSRLMELMKNNRGELNVV